MPTLTEVTNVVYNTINSSVSGTLDNMYQTLIPIKPKKVSIREKYKNTCSEIRAVTKHGLLQPLRHLEVYRDGSGQNIYFGTYDNGNIALVRNRTTVIAYRCRYTHLFEQLAEEQSMRFKIWDKNISSPRNTIDCTKVDWFTKPLPRLEKEKKKETPKTSLSLDYIYQRIRANVATVAVNGIRFGDTHVNACIEHYPWAIDEIILRLNAGDIDGAVLFPDSFPLRYTIDDNGILLLDCPGAVVDQGATQAVADGPNIYEYSLPTRRTAITYNITPF